MSWTNDATITTAEDKAAADLDQRRRALKATRDEALRSMVYTLADGSALQTRPEDLNNLRMAIDIGSSRDWVLEDNTVRETTPGELTEALAAAVEEAEEIWQVYTQAIRGLK